MNDLKAYNIPFVGLKVGPHVFNYEIDNTFFKYFEYQEFNNAQLKVDLTLTKKETLLELAFNIKGNVNVNCDLTNEPFNQPLHATLNLVVKFGEEYNDENIDILILPHGSYQINVAQYIYEAIVLALPLKRIHPGIEDGTLNSDILDKLEELSPKEKETNTIDPRWDSLKKLLTDK